MLLDNCKTKFFLYVNELIETQFFRKSTTNRSKRLFEELEAAMGRSLIPEY
jgi:hypothetical protein